MPRFSAEQTFPLFFTISELLNSTLCCYLRDGRKLFAKATKKISRRRGISLRCIIGGLFFVPAGPTHAHKPESPSSVSPHFLIFLFPRGTLASNGKQFDSSHDRGKPFEFTIGKGDVIQGWDEGVMKMSLGEKALLKIDSDYGYGEEGAGGVIPPNADLNFEVELLGIGSKQADISSESGCCVIC